MATGKYTPASRKMVKSTNQLNGSARLNSSMNAAASTPQKLRATSASAPTTRAESQLAREKSVTKNVTPTTNCSAMTSSPSTATHSEGPSRMSGDGVRVTSIGSSVPASI